ncbi:hypothetical protein M0R45_011756 [Rubus argutus]|uniref:Uncharacterized protein n=1 Tax=Rubus argutus TaxID=59490 RepID=A0AAW1YB68_RUBAR
MKTKKLLDSEGEPLPGTELKEARDKAPDKAPTIGGSRFHQLLGIKGASQETDLTIAFIKVLDNEKAYKEVFNISGGKHVTFDGLAKACTKATTCPELRLFTITLRTFILAKR